MSFIISRRSVIAGLVFGVFAIAAQAQDFPNRPITLVVSTAAGSSADTLARLLAQHMGETLKQPIIVDNKPGANTIIATQFVAKAAPDGYTLLLTGDQTFATNPYLYPNLPYSKKSFAPIAKAVDIPMVLAVNPNLPVKTVKELIEYAKKHPKELNYGSGGNGSPQHLPMALFEQMSRTEMMHVPYKGAPNVTTALISGEINAAFLGPATIAPYMKDGKLRALGISDVQRSSALPDVPTIAESGLPGYEVTYWMGLLAPAGTPEPIVKKFQLAVANALAAPDIKTKLHALGYVPRGTTSEEFRRILDQDGEKWQPVLKAAGLINKQ